MAVLGDVKRLTRRIFLLQQLTTLWMAPPGVYLGSLAMALSDEQLSWMLKHAYPHTNIIFGIILPYCIIYFALKWGLTTEDGEPPGVVLGRMLKVPRIIDIGIQLNYSFGALQYALFAWWKFGTEWYRAPWSALVFSLLTMLVMIWGRVVFSRILSPVVLEQFVKNPEVELSNRGLFWPRQSWYLPYAFAVFVVFSVLMTVTVFIGKSSDVFQLLVRRLKEAHSTDIEAVIYSTISEFIRQASVPILLMGLFLVASASIVAWTLARHETEGSQSIQHAILSLTSGHPTLPQWVSTDELGDLASATARAFERLRSFSLSLLHSARQLGQSAEQLNSSSSSQNEMISRQAAAIQETQVTAQEIKSTSQLTAEKAESILHKVEQADEIGRSGEVALERSMESMRDIRLHVSQMTDKIKVLEERARQIGNITQTVKDLADQSNMLALNAAIEAVRSGESGKGFGVVAREIRSLADQSIAATQNVRRILQDISSAIRESVHISEQGSKKIEASLVEINVFGENIRALSAIVRDNATAVRQISAAVSQQNMGISQIFQAISELSGMMEETMSRMSLTRDTTMLVQDVAQKVFSAVNSYGWQQGSPEQGEGAGPAGGPSGGAHGR